MKTIKIQSRVYEIDCDPDNILGQGAFGTVYAGTFIKNAPNSKPEFIHGSVAVKVIPLKTMLQEEIVK